MTKFCLTNSLILFLYSGSIFASSLILALQRTIGCIDQLEDSRLKRQSFLSLDLAML